MLVSWILSVLLTAVAIFLVAKLLPGVRIRGFSTAIVVALVYALLHALLFKLLVLLTLPAVLVSFGLFLFLINAFLLWLTDQLVEGFEIESLGMTLFASLAISLVSFLLRLPFLP